MPETNVPERNVPESNVPEGKPRPWWQPTASQFIVAVLLGGLAFAMVAQFRGSDDTDYSGVRRGELVELLKSLDAANDRANTQIDSLRSSRNDLLSNSKRSEQAAKQVREQADDLAILAGQVGATGPGVRLKITDPKAEIDAAVLLNGIEELRDAGAEAIAVNGSARIVAQTYFLDDGAAIRIDGRQVKRPFTIEAIGDSSTLAEAVRFRGGLQDLVKNRGGTLAIENRDTVTITALADVKTPEYARPTS